MAKKKKARKMLPKRLAGVKVPKGVRKGFNDFMSSQSGKAIAAEAVALLGAAVLGAHESRRGSVTRRVGKELKEDAKALTGKAAHAGEDAADMAHDASDRFSRAFAAAAAAFKDSLAEDDAFDRPLVDEAPSVTAKKQKAARPPAPIEGGPTLAH